MIAASGSMTTHSHSAARAKIPVIYAPRSLRRLPHSDPESFRARLGDYADGPVSLAELFSWPSRIWAIFTEPERGRLVHNASLLNVHTANAGVGSVAWAWLSLCEDLRTKGVRVPLPTFVEAYERHPVRREALLALPSSVQARHVFSHMLEIDPAVKDALGDVRWPTMPLKPSPTAPQRDLAQFDTDCQLYQRSLEEAALAIMGLLQQSRSVASLQEHRARCHRHGDACDAEETDAEQGAGRVSMAVAGSAATAWTCTGRWSASSNVDFLLWLGDVARRQHGLLILESMPQCTVSLLRAHLPPAYAFTSIVVGPDHFGAPVHRDRRYTVGIHREKVVLLQGFQDFLDQIGVKQL